MYKQFFLALLFFPPNMAWSQPMGRGARLRRQENAALSSGAATSPTTAVATVQTGSTALTASADSTTSTTATTETTFSTSPTSSVSSALSAPSTSSTPTTSTTSATPTSTSLSTASADSSASPVSAEQPITPAPSAFITPATVVAPVTAAAPTSTDSIQLAQALLDGSSAECTETGGGCDMFQYALSSCTDDSCACIDDTTLAAMVCAQCGANEGMVSVYNAYLTVCVSGGKATPSDTLVVTITADTPTTAPAQGIPSTAMASDQMASDGMTSAGLPLTVAALAPTSGAVPTEATPEVAALQVTDDAAESSSALVGPGSAVAISGFPTNGPDGSVIPTSGALLTDFVAHTALSETVLPTGTSGVATPSGVDPSTASILNPSSLEQGDAGKSTSALQAAKGYFSVEIDAKCNSDCQTWKSLATDCTSDQCICTQSAILSAGACSSCLGSTTHGAVYQSQMAYYTGFTGNCSTEAASLSISATASSGTYDTVPDATGTDSVNAWASASTTGASATAAGAAEAVVTIQKSGAVGLVPGRNWVKSAIAAIPPLLVLL